MHLDPQSINNQDRTDFPGTVDEAQVPGGRRQADGPPGQRIAKLARLELADAATRRHVVIELEGRTQSYD